MEIQHEDITQMTIQHCMKLICFIFLINSLYSLNGGHVEKSPPPFPAATDPIQIASSFENVPHDT